MFYLTIVNKHYVTVTLGWHDNSHLHFEMFINSLNADCKSYNTFLHFIYSNKEK